MMMPPRNFEEFEAILPELGYTESMIWNIRPEIRRAPKIYKQPAPRISTDPLAFEEKWGRGRIS